MAHNRNRVYPNSAVNFWPPQLSGVTMFWHHGIMLDSGGIQTSVVEEIAGATIAFTGTTAAAFDLSVSDRAAISCTSSPRRFFACNSRTRGDLFDDTGYDFFMVARMNAYVTTSGFWYLDPCLFVDDGIAYMGLSTSSSGLVWTHYDGSFKSTTHTAPSVGVPFLFHARYDGTNISTRINAGSAQTVAAGSMISGPPNNYQNITFKFGRSYTTGNGAPGVEADADISACICAKTLTSTESNNLRSWVGGQYGIAV